MNPEGVRVNFASQCSLHFDKHQKIKFIAYIYIRFNQNLDDISYIIAKIDAVKHLQAVFLLTAEKRRRPIRLYRAMVYLRNNFSLPVNYRLLTHVVGGRSRSINSRRRKPG